MILKITIALQIVSLAYLAHLIWQMRKTVVKIRKEKRKEGEPQ